MNKTDSIRITCDEATTHVNEMLTCPDLTQLYQRDIHIKITSFDAKKKVHRTSYNANLIHPMTEEEERPYKRTRRENQIEPIGTFFDEMIQNDRDRYRTRVIEYQTMMYNARKQRREAVQKASIIDQKRCIQ